MAFVLRMASKTLPTTFESLLAGSGGREAKLLSVGGRGFRHSRRAREKVQRKLGGKRIGFQLHS